MIEGAPPGGEQDFLLIKHVGEPPVFDFEPRDHLELGEGLAAIDMERGAKVSGARFYFLRGVGAQLQWAMLTLAVNKAIANGFIPMIPPVLVKPESMEGTGFLGEHADEVYRLAADDLYLVGTSEVPLAAYHSGEILDLASGPARYVGWSSCFRREAGSYGKDTRGIIRVHQFDKVEMFSYCRPEEAAAEHLRMLALRGGDAGRDGDPLPGHRCRCRRSRYLGRQEVRLRGLGADPAGLPGADLDLELHHVPGPPARLSATGTRTASRRSRRR